jgi:hypothetical protein
MPLSHAALKSQLQAVFESLPTSHSQAAAGWDAAFQVYVTAMPSTYGPLLGPPLLLTGTLTGLFAGFAGGAAVGNAIGAAVTATLAGGITPSLSSSAPAAGVVGSALASTLGTLLAAPPDKSHSAADRAQAIADVTHAAFSLGVALTTPPPIPFPPPPGSLIPS